VIRHAFNDGWHFTSHRSAFEQLGGDNGAVQVTLPHDAVLSGGRSAEGSEGSNTGYFRGGAWQYEKSFEVPDAWSSRRVTLEFEGVYRDAMVYINGEFAGQWANGYSTFYVPIDPYLRYGQANTVRVEAQAHQDSRWYSGGGMHRPAHLLVGDMVHVTPTGLRVTTPEVDDRLAVAAVSTTVTNESPHTRTVEVLLEVRDPDGAVVATDHARVTVLANESLTVRQRTYVREPARWSVDTPNLYTATVRLHDADGQIDQASTTFGVRTLSLDPERGLRINGETVKLRGACVHHDNGVLGAAAFASAEERRIRLLKEAGFNAIRSTHNPMSTAMLEACDRLGMLVMDETFDMWTRAKSADDYSRRFPGWWERDVDALVAKDFNHPSVIFYSIGNEILEVGTPHGSRWGRLIAERVRAQDPTRLITNAINGMLTILDDLPAVTSSEDVGDGNDGGFNAALANMSRIAGTPQVGERITESASVVDVLGLNYGESRYALDLETFPNRIVLGSETFPTMIEEYWKLVTEHDHVIGDFAWTGWDYLGEVGIGGPIYPGADATFKAPYPWLTAFCGDIDITGRRRPISYYREIVFGLRDQPYLAVQRPEHGEHPVQAQAWAWTDTVASWTWDVPAGTPVVAEAYADADEIAFEVNGTQRARVPVGTTKAFVATAEVPYEAGTLAAVAYRQGVEVGRVELSSATAAQRLHLTADRDAYRADPQDLVYVDITLVDENGTIHTCDERTVTVELDGPATLQGLGSARPVTEESFLRATTTTYEGHALAVVRPTGDPGQVTVSVRSDGGHTASLEIGLLPEPAQASPQPQPSAS
jgi:beta-galactosidase